MNRDILEDIKKTELNLFRCFEHVCKTKAIRYFLIGGSCLGAVRHSGFIPWDDDIDVGIPRSDYEKFLSCAQEMLPEGVFLQTFITDRGYLQNFAKLRDSRTTFIETSSKDFPINHGVYLDVFPLDGAGNNYFVAKLHFNVISFFKARIAMEYCVGNNVQANCIKRIKRRLKRLLLLIICPSAKTCIKINEKLYKKYSYEDSIYISNYSGAWGKKEIVKKELFGEGINGTFEGLSVTLPKRYDDYLTCVYGDYMTLPPSEKRVAHHFCTVIDTKRPYTEYL